MYLAQIAGKISGDETGANDHEVPVPVGSPKQKNCLWTRNQFTKGCQDLGIKQVTSVLSCNSQPGENITVGSRRNALGKQATGRSERSQRVRREKIRQQRLEGENNKYIHSQKDRDKPKT